LPRTNKADHPRERVVLTCIPEPIQPEDIAPMKALRRTDGVCIVYDPALPPGARTASTHESIDAAIAAARERKARNADVRRLRLRREP
jgi:hypothetical protein